MAYDVWYAKSNYGPLIFQFGPNSHEKIKSIFCPVVTKSLQEYGLKEPLFIIQEPAILSTCDTRGDDTCLMAW